MRRRQPGWRYTRRDAFGLGRGLRRGLGQLQDVAAAAAVAVVDGGAGGRGGVEGRHHAVGDVDDGGWVIGLAAGNDGICRSFFRSL